LWEISTPPQLIEEIQQKCGVNGPFGFYGNERNNQRLDSCVIRSADLYQDFVAASSSPGWRGIWAVGETHSVCVTAFTGQSLPGLPVG
jgi:hypothetical protein